MARSDPTTALTSLICEQAIASAKHGWTSPAQQLTNRLSRNCETGNCL